MRVFSVHVVAKFVGTNYDKDSLKQSLEDIGINMRLAKDLSVYDGFNVIATESQIVDMTVMGLTFKILDQTVVFADNIEISHRMSAIAARLDEIMDGHHTWNDSYHNQKAGCYQPGEAMLRFNDTLLLEDCCTDRLQQSLDKGWRLIVACPQPDTRRPDYILGRYNPDMIPTGQARRVV